MHKMEEEQVGSHWRNSKHTKWTAPKSFQVTHLFLIVFNKTLLIHEYQESFSKLKKKSNDILIT